jgi:hypothetical protein
VAISFPVSVPAIGGIAGVKFTMLDVVGASESPYTLSQEFYEHPGKRWGIDVQLVPMLRANGEEWAAFLASLRGRRGTFLLGDPLGKRPRGAGTGYPFVKGSGQSGGTINIDGCTAGVTNWLRKGDWIQEGTGAQAHLHKCLTDVNSDGIGDATLELWPGPRTPLADNAPLVVVNTLGVWRLASNTRQYDLATGQIFGFTFQAVEAL